MRFLSLPLFRFQSDLRSLGERTKVGLTRLELVTSPLSGVRSNHLSYRPSDDADSKSQSMRLADILRMSLSSFRGLARPLKTEPE